MTTDSQHDTLTFREHHTDGPQRDLQFHNLASRYSFSTIMSVVQVIPPRLGRVQSYSMRSAKEALGTQRFRRVEVIYLIYRHWDWIVGVLQGSALCVNFADLAGDIHVFVIIAGHVDCQLGIASQLDCLVEEECEVL